MSTIPLEERVFHALAAEADEVGEVTIGLAERAVAAGRTRTQRHPSGRPYDGWSSAG